MGGCAGTGGCHGNPPNGPGAFHDVVLGASADLPPVCGAHGPGHWGDPHTACEKGKEYIMVITLYHVSTV